MSLSPIEKAASGALASVIANTIVYPIDLSKTLIQTQVKKDEGSGNKKLEDSDDSVSQRAQKVKYKNTFDVLRKIHAKKGILGWYHGLFSSLLGTAAQNFSYFYWYSVVKRIYHNINKHIPNHKPTTGIELFLGALAAAISQMFTMPIGVITTQQQTDHSSKNLLDITKDVLEQDGITGLWRGLRVSLVLCINPSITYGSYERLKQILFNGKQFLSPLESFLIGMLAKSLATIVTQPLIVSKAMVQKKASKKVDEEEEDEDIKFDSFIQCLIHLWKTENIKGLYKGVAPQLLKGVFVQGLLFMFKDQLDILFLFLLQIIRRKRTLKA